MTYDFTVVGGGIVGLSTALELTRRHPGSSTLVLEKESGWAAHQSGHNSGVIHSGIYYPPGSLKARLCTEGRQATLDFCREQGIPCEVCGKVIVATREEELPHLAELETRGRANGLEVRVLGPEELREIEPHVRGVRALYVPASGIVDYRRVAEAFAHIAGERGADLRTGAGLRAVRVMPDGLALETEAGSFMTRFLVNCAGLHADRVAAMMGARPPARIVPFRGEYFELVEGRRGLVRNLIYPVPDPDLPFLGVHFTRSIDGAVHAGPNAVLALSREGYGWGDVSLKDTAEAMAYPGFWRLVARFPAVTAMELHRSLSKRRFAKSLQRLVPEVRVSDLAPGGSGVRAQALTPKGELVHDFLIVPAERSMHVCNAPSPAATAALPIGRAIVDRIPESFTSGARSRHSASGSA
ncbi:MAG: L-2-hydroxyglutarate oxidase [Candidatus Palauibacterales bacterium]|nr:L-2-hydroxyglutarate oxidase [Candidatus Palauibacterales bacterium]MDP2528327.1 L-2-hydroxyglutarate oxidase [Candidatus Palauibacterales bacterium]MDP2584196.1 L-2-hydroxyglutarate oxidase [Candidatus Palauibacterales bacterium]